MYELVLRAPQALVEPVSDALIDELAALSVSVEDADAGSGAEQALFGEPGLPAPQPGWNRSTLQALFADEPAASAAAAVLLAGHGSDGLLLQSLQPLAERDWVRLTQSQFAPVAIADGFWVVPSWHEIPAGARQVIRLDPGLAFGTGTHPTTQMCLRWLAGACRAAGGSRACAYSTTAAARASWPSVRRCTAPPTSTRWTSTRPPCRPPQANALANGVRLRAGLPDAIDGRYDVVLANILATPLKLLAPLLCGRLQPAGRLVLAGTWSARPTS